MAGFTNVATSIANPASHWAATRLIYRNEGVKLTNRSGITVRLTEFHDFALLTIAVFPHKLVARLIFPSCVCFHSVRSDGYRRYHARVLHFWFVDDDP